MKFAENKVRFATAEQFYLSGASASAEALSHTGPMLLR